MSDDPAPTLYSTRETAKSTLTSIDTQQSTSGDTLQISAHAETEKPRSGGKTRKKKRK